MQLAGYEEETNNLLDTVTALFAVGGYLGGQHLWIPCTGATFPEGIPWTILRIAHVALHRFSTPDTWAARQCLSNRQALDASLYGAPVWLWAIRKLPPCGSCQGCDFTTMLFISERFEARTAMKQHSHQSRMATPFRLTQTIGNY